MPAASRRGTLKTSPSQAACRCGPGNWLAMVLRCGISCHTALRFSSSAVQRCLVTFSAKLATSSPSLSYPGRQPLRSLPRTGASFWTCSLSFPLSEVRSRCHASWVVLPPSPSTCRCPGYRWCPAHPACVLPQGHGLTSRLSSHQGPGPLRQSWAKRKCSWPSMLCTWTL